MRNGLIAETLLSLTSPADRAESMAGDLLEEARSRGRFWFAAAVAGVMLGMFFQAFGTARARTLRLLALGLAVWFAVYVAARVAGALIGVEPLMIDARDVGALRLGTLLYLGVLLVLANLVTGFVLGCRGTVNGMSPVMPLALFWATTAVIGFCSDVVSGTPTWYCTLIYLGGLPLLYIAPLLLGGVLAAQAAPAPRLGVSR